MNLTRSVKQARADDTAVDGLGRGPGPKAMWFVYPFFSVHMLAFGLTGFLVAYMSDAPDLMFLYLHGGIAIFVYIVFYLVIFGRDAVSWMLLNAALGIIGSMHKSAGSSNASASGSRTSRGRCTWCPSCTTSSTPSCCASS